MANADRLVYSIPEVAKKLGINLVSAYELAKKRGFPAIQVSQRRIIVPKVALERWLEAEAVKGRADNG